MSSVIWPSWENYRTNREPKAEDQDKGYKKPVVSKGVQQRVNESCKNMALLQKPLKY